jgi:hypothetical protein
MARVRAAAAAAWAWEGVGRRAAAADAAWREGAGGGGAGRDQATLEALWWSAAQLKRRRWAADRRAAQAGLWEQRAAEAWSEEVWGGPRDAIEILWPANFDLLEPQVRAATWAALASSFGEQLWRAAFELLDTQVRDGQRAGQGG